MAIDLKAVKAHFGEFAGSRRGVEAYIEPATRYTATTVVLIAHDGEWTRRAVGTPAEGYRLAEALRIPAYDVQRTGYPQAMRDWTSRMRGVTHDDDGGV